MSDLPEWLANAVTHETKHVGLYDSARVHRIAAESLRDLERVAQLTADLDDPRAAAMTLFGGRQ